MPEGSLTAAARPGRISVGVPTNASVSRRAALLAAYDGVLRIKAGKLMTEPDPRDGEDAIARLLCELAGQNGVGVADMLGIMLAAALHAAHTQALNGRTEARQALEELLS